MGALDKDEWDHPLPFAIFYDRDILTVTDNEIEVAVGNDIFPRISRDVTVLLEV